MWQHLFPKTNWTAFLKESGNPLKLEPLHVIPFLKELILECAELLETGQIGKAIDRISLGIILNKSEFLSRLKKSGLLRYSHYIDMRNPVAGIAKHMLSNYFFYKLIDEEVRYFESLQNMEAYAMEMNHLFQFVTITLRKYKSRKLVKLGEIPAKASIIKSLIALNDHSFLTRTDTGPYVQPEDKPVFTMEQRSDAISFLLSRADELIKIEQSDLITIDETFITSNKAEHLILDACRFKKYKEFEISIEEFGYICRKIGKNYRIEYHDERTFKSLELSHIIGHLQKNADSVWISKAFGRLPSIKELAVEVNKAFPNIVQFKKEPYARFTMNLPGILIADISKQDVGYFSEEYHALEYIQNDMSLSLDDLGEYEIAAQITLYEFMKIDRVFRVIQQIYSERVREQENAANYLVVLNSILALFKQDDIVEIFKGIIPSGKLIKYLEIMSWEIGKGQYLDLQYTPIVRSGNYYLLSLSVMKHSRSIRNISASLAKRGINAKGAQMKLLKQVPSQLAEVFIEKGFVCHTDLKIYFKGRIQIEGDIDFFAYKDGHLFIAECKDVLDSIDAFEYRRVNDYLLKAASQLDYLKSAITDPVYQVSLSSRVNVNLSEVTKIHYLIVPTARKMYGHSVGEYPVRYMHELMAFVKEGIWNYKLPESKLHSFELWAKKDFQVSDLIMFCSNDGPHSETIKALFHFDKVIGKHISERQYALDIELAFNNLKNRYRFVEHDIEFDVDDTRDRAVERRNS